MMKKERSGSKKSYSKGASDLALALSSRPSNDFIEQTSRHFQTRQPPRRALVNQMILPSPNPP
jgi:hypothetical protein